MHNSLEVLSKKLLKSCEKRGEKARIKRETGLSSSQLDKYIAMSQIPGIDQLDKLALALDKQPWELIKPEGEISSHPDPLLAGIIDIWPVLNNNQQRLVSETARAFTDRDSSQKAIDSVS